MSRLYIVSTPIGNLADITQRALDVLGAVDRILAEDTRRTSGLLDHYDISARLVAVHEHNEAARSERAVEWLDAGEELALASDAGTPLVSDPGTRLVQEATRAGHTIVPLPGPSAVLAALVGSGLDPEPFTFYGFVPRKGVERADRLGEIAESPYTAVLYEAANRLVGLLRDLERRCGPEREVAVARELTKLYETFFRGTLAETRSYYEEEGARGEVVVIVAGRAGAVEEQADAAEATARVLGRALLDAGRRPSTVASEIARRTEVSRNRAYDLALKLAGEGDEGESA